jgi:hypothetical protein
MIQARMMDSVPIGNSKWFCCFQKSWLDPSTWYVAMTMTNHKKEFVLYLPNKDYFSIANHRVGNPAMWAFCRKAFRETEL